MSTFGALEFDPDINNDKNRADFKHREFLKEKVKFKQIIKIEDESISNKIHVNFRLTYLKDTALARCIEDHTL